MFFFFSPPPPIYVFFFLLLVVKLEPYQHIKTLCKRDIRMRIQLDTFDSGLNVTAADPTVCNRVRKHTAPVIWQREFIKCQQLKRLGSRWSLKVSVFTQNHANKGRGGGGGCFLNSLTDIWNSQAWGKHYKFISCQLDVALELLNAEPKKITSEWTQRWGLWTAKPPFSSVTCEIVKVSSVSIWTLFTTAQFITTSLKVLYIEEQ